MEYFVLFFLFYLEVINPLDIHKVMFIYSPKIDVFSHKKQS